MRRAAADNDVMRNPHFAAVVSGALMLALATGCSSHHGTPVAPAPTRSYRMGFSAIPPRPDFPTQLATLDLMKSRCDAALLLSEAPWDSLLAGVRADSIVIRNQLGLADWYRAHGFRIVVSLDPTNGLDRSADSAPLVAQGRSLTEPAIRQLYRNYAVALDTLVHPDWFSVGSETNLVRAIAPPALYDAMKLNAQAAADTLAIVDPSVKVFTTVQVEVAWGRLVPSGTYVGIAQDLADFPFTAGVGLSSYPYLGGWADPDSLPADYFSRITTGTSRPALMIEGGWSSQTVGGIDPTTPDEQRRYIAREAALLETAGAVAWFQITFTDLDLAYFPAGVAPFAWLGLVDASLVPKPALSAWDAECARALR
jgi:hypothetical protein